MSVAHYSSAYAEGAPRVVTLLCKVTANRDVAQVVARVVRDHEAAGSNPVIPIFFIAINYQSYVYIQIVCNLSPNLLIFLYKKSKIIMCDF